jgi:hypothetical protein
MEEGERRFIVNGQLAVVMGSSGEKSILNVKKSENGIYYEDI